MDINILRTFVEVSRTRHFGKAAENLFITQSAVSARIRLLEETLKVQLLTRDRNNISLTPAGVRLMRYAETIMNTWQRAKQETAIDSENIAQLSICSTFGLWESLVQDWLHNYHFANPKVALNVEVDSLEGLRRKLAEGTLDVGFAFDLPDGPWESRKIAELPLIMVSSKPQKTIEDAMQKSDYVFVEWGTKFLNKHIKAYPEIGTPHYRMNLGSMALKFLLNCGGTAYLPKPMAEPYLQEKRLFLVHDAIIMTREVFAYFPLQSHQQDLINSFLGAALDHTGVMPSELEMPRENKETDKQN